MKLKVVNKKKFLKSNIIIVIFIFSLCILINSSKSNTKINYKIEYISKGETLWDIADKQYKENKYYEGTDIRDIICSLRKINNIEDGKINEGEKIKIPCF